MGSIRTMQREKSRENLANKKLLSLITHPSNFELSALAKAIETLIAEGANVNIKWQNRTITQILCWMFPGRRDEERPNFMRTLELLLDHGAVLEPYQLSLPGYFLTESVRWGFDALAKKLLDLGIDVDSRGGCGGKVALMHALINQNPEMVKLLVNRGADVNIEPENSSTIREFAAAWGDKDILKLLEDAGMK